MLYSWPVYSNVARWKIETTVSFHQLYPCSHRITTTADDGAQDIILVMEPATVLGALAGTYANKLLASWITTTLLSIVMAYMTFTLLKKGIKGWALETARAAHHHHAVTEPLLAPQDVQTVASSEEEPPPRTDKHGGDECCDEDSGSEALVEEEVEVGPLVHDLRRLSRSWSVQRQEQLPARKIAVLLALFCGMCHIKTRTETRCW